MQRRAFAVVAAGTLAAAAGCSTRRIPFVGPTAPPATSPDAAPKEYLPPGGGGWTRAETNAVAAEEAGAEAGAAATYTRPGVEEEYNVEILRWPDPESADKTAPNWYGGWKTFVVREQWSFAARGPNRDRVPELLGRSPVLTTAWVRAYDRGRG